ncbi:MAG TPA: HD domain-containing phosphohydrolase [Gammaproteobacteria bacterium]|nr:HD domain-containing phosphohydrolase [Gammaproteobacteria bacterium]
MPHRVGRTPTGRPLTFNADDPAELDRALQQQEVFFSAILDDLPVMVSRFLPDGTLTFVNEPICRAFGTSREDLVGSSLFDRIPGDQQAAIRAGIASLSPECPQWTSENRVLGADGGSRWQRWTNRGLFDEQGRLHEIQAVGEDITEARSAEERARGVLRARRSLGAVTEAVTRAATEAELLERVCGAMVSETGYEMAWIGFPGRDPAGSLRIAAHGGDHGGYLDDLVVSTRADRPEGQGPSGLAFRTGRAVTTADLQGDPMTAPWHDLAARAGMRAAASLPLRERDRVFGILAVYSASPCTFADQELGLLQELADELAFGILSLRASAEARTASGERDRLAAILDATPDFVGIADPQGHILYHNQAARRILGLGPGQSATRRQVEHSHVPWSARKVMEEGFPAAMADGVWTGEVALRDAAGRETPFSQTILAHHDESGAVAYLSTIARDISAQKEAQERLRNQFFTAVEVFGNLLELRSEHLAGHCRRVADLAVAMARDMGCDGTEVDDIRLAALLHEVGKLGLPETTLSKPESLLTDTERRQLKRHPVLGEAALMALEPLDRPARLIRHHHEHLDGSGYPDALLGRAIPRGARLLAVANEFDGLCHGHIFMQRMAAEEALGHLRARAGRAYDPEALAALERAVREGYPPAAGGPPAEEPASARLSGKGLRPGMVLAADLLTPEGVPLLSEGCTLDERAVKKIRKLERRLRHPVRATVYAAGQRPGTD